MSDVQSINDSRAINLTVRGMTTLVKFVQPAKPSLYTSVTGFP